MKNFHSIIRYYKFLIFHPFNIYLIDLNSIQHGIFIVYTVYAFLRLHQIDSVRKPNSGISTYFNQDGINPSIG